MKFFVAVLVLALVALSSASEEAAAAKPVQKLEPVNEPEAAVADGAQRDKRGFVLTAYTAPVAAAAAVPAVEVASPYTAAYTAPVAYAYSASLPYAYRAYSPYYSYPAVYV